MSVPQLQMRSTVEEYLALERASEERHEYVDGHVYAINNVILFAVGQ